MKEKQYKTFVGADLHKDFTQFVTQDINGKEISSIKMNNDETMFRLFLSGLPQPLKVVVEATGNSGWFCDTVKKGGFEVVVAHPTETSAKSGTREKSDRKDARMLATLLRGNLIEKKS